MDVRESVVLAFSKTQRTAVDIAGAIRRREVSATEVVDAHLTRIRAANEAINAVVTLCEEQARQRAHEADEALSRGECWGPLHRVPLTVKDAYATAGIRTTLGHPTLTDNIPAWDATPISRLVWAGAILLGKTNMPPFGANFQSDNEIFGRTNNPWDLTRTSGGSSGGGTAAVASGMTPLELGGDLAGSIRVPAHYCGVYAIKPTEFLVPAGRRAEGDPPAPRNVRHMAQPGPIARSVEDIILGLRLIAGPDGIIREVPPVPLKDPPRRPLTSYRVAWCAELPGARVSAAIDASIRALVDGLGRAGCSTTESLPRGWQFTSLMETWAELAYAEIGAGLDGSARDEMRQEKRFAPDSDDALLRGAYRGLEADVRAYAGVLHRRDVAAAALDRLLDEVDVLIMPTSMTTAIPHWPTGEPVPVDGREETYWTVGLGYTVACNLTGHPAVTCPVGRADDGLPVGLQVVGRRWGDTQSASPSSSGPLVYRRSPAPDLLLLERGPAILLCIGGRMPPNLRRAALVSSLRVCARLVRAVSDVTRPQLLQHDNTSRRQPVADFETLGQPQILQLPHVQLERLLFLIGLGCQVSGSDPVVGIEQGQDILRPLARAAGLVQTLEPKRHLPQFVRYQLRLLPQRNPRVGADPLETDLVDLSFPACQVSDYLFRTPVTGLDSLRVGYSISLDAFHGLDAEQPDRRLQLSARLLRRPTPPSERGADFTGADEAQNILLEEHSRRGRSHPRIAQRHRLGDGLLQVKSKDRLMEIEVKVQ